MQPWKCACGLKNAGEDVNCRRCGKTLLDARSARHVAPADACPKCSGSRALVTEKPNFGAGAVICVLAGLVGIFALFLPGLGFFFFLLVALVMLFVGVNVAGKTKQHWHCRGCGVTFPV